MNYKWTYKINLRSIKSVLGFVAEEADTNYEVLYSINLL